mgnify:CR=1 FL=1|jgi:hypothetical protein
MKFALRLKGHGWEFVRRGVKRYDYDDEDTVRGLEGAELYVQQSEAEEAQDRHPAGESLMVEEVDA